MDDFFVALMGGAAPQGTASGGRQLMVDAAGFLSSFGSIADPAAVNGAVIVGDISVSDHKVDRFFSNSAAIMRQRHAEGSKDEIDPMVAPDALAIPFIMGPADPHIAQDVPKPTGVDGVITTLGQSMPDSVDPGLGVFEIVATNVQAEFSISVPISTHPILGHPPDDTGTEIGDRATVKWAEQPPLPGVFSLAPTLALATSMGAILPFSPTAPMVDPSVGQLTETPAVPYAGPPHTVVPMSVQLSARHSQPATIMQQQVPTKIQHRQDVMPAIQPDFAPMAVQMAQSPQPQAPDVVQKLLPIAGSVVPVTDLEGDEARVLAPTKASATTAITLSPGVSLQVPVGAPALVAVVESPELTELLKHGLPSSDLATPLPPTRPVTDQPATLWALPTRGAPQSAQPAARLAAPPPTAPAISPAPTGPLPDESAVAIAPSSIVSVPKLPIAIAATPPTPVDAPPSEIGLPAASVEKHFSGPVLSDRAAVFTQPAHTFPQIAQALADPGRDRGAPLDLALDPPELGRLRLSFMEINGMLTLVIAAERPETADLMRRNFGLLIQEFARAGVDAPMVSISDGGGGGRHDPRPARSGPDALVHGDLADDTVGSTRPIASRPMPLGNLDLRV